MAVVCGCSSAVCRALAVCSVEGCLPCERAMRAGSIDACLPGDSLLTASLLSAVCAVGRLPCVRAVQGGR